MKAPSPRSAVLVGVEQEFELFAGERKLDFREHVGRLRSPKVLAFHARADAFVTTTGFVLSTDGAEAELAIAPHTLDEFTARDVAREVRRVRREAFAAFGALGVTVMRGYSTHLSIGVPAEADVRVAWELVRRAGPALVLALEAAASEGITVRPRGARVEVCTDFIDDEDRLTTAIALLAGSVSAILQDAPAVRGLPTMHLVRVEPGAHRPGFFLPRDAFGASIHAGGRATSLQLETRDFSHTTAGEVLDAWAGVAATALGERDAAAALEALRGPLPSSQPLDVLRQVTVPEQPSAPTRAGLELAALQSVPGVVFVDWRGVAVRSGERVATVPRTSWPRLHREDAPAWLAGLPVEEAWLSTLPQLGEQLSRPGADLEALGEEARTGKSPPRIPLRPGGPFIPLHICFIQVHLLQTHLCPGDIGFAFCNFWPWGQLQWVMPPGLTLLSGQGTWFITFQVKRAGCMKVRCVLLPPHGDPCSSAQTLSVPEAGLMTADGQTVACLGLAGHAPAIVLERPVPSGSRDAEARFASATGTSEANFSGTFTVSGYLVDPLGFSGAKLSATGDGLEAPQSIAIQADGRFEFPVTARGLGLKRLVLRCEGLTGARGVTVLSGLVEPGPELDAALEESVRLVGQVAERRAEQTRKLLFGEAGQPLRPLNDATWAALDEELERVQQERDGVDEAAFATALRTARARWSVGRSLGHDRLPAASRKRLIVFDCLPDPGMTADFQGHAFALEEAVSMLVSTKPEALVAVSTAHDGEAVPNQASDIMVSIDRAEEVDAQPIGYRDCQLSGALPFRVELDGATHSLLYRPPREPAAAGALGVLGGPVAGAPVVEEVRTLVGRLHARFTGAAVNVKQFEWRVAYGPDPEGVQLEPSGPLREDCAFTARVAGLYLIEARLVSDHDDPLAAAVAEIEAVELVFTAAHDLDPRHCEVREEGVRVSADAGTFQLSAEVLAVGDGGCPAHVVESITPRFHWTRRDALEQRDFDGEEPALDWTVPTAAGERVEAAVSVTGLVVRDTRGGRTEHDVSTLGITAQHAMTVKAGAAAKVEARAAVGSSWSPWLPLRDQGPTQRSASIADGFSLATRFAELGVNDPRQVFFQLAVTDDAGNPVEAGVPVAADALGTARLVLPASQQRPLTTDARGKLQLQLQAPQDTAAHALVRLEVGQALFFVGNPLAALSFSLAGDERAPQGDETTVRQGSGLLIKNLEGEARGELRVQFNGRPVPEGTAVTLVMGKGAVSTDRVHWRSQLKVTTRAGGVVPLFFTPQSYTPDGTRRWYAVNTWGKTNLMVQAGPSTHSFTVEFESSASLELAPEFDLAGSLLVQQSDLAPIAPIGDHHLVGPPRVQGRLRAVPGREVLLEVAEHAEPRLMERLTFDSVAVGTVNPVVVSAGPGDAPYVPRFACQFAEIHLGGAQPGLRAMVDGVVVSAAGKRSLKLTDQAPPLSSVTAAFSPALVPLLPATPGAPPPAPSSSPLAWPLAVVPAIKRYAAPVAGSAGFRVTLRLRITTQRDWEVLRVEGTAADGSVLEGLGQLTLSVAGLATGAPALIARYSARACSRPGAEVWVSAPITRHQWTDISLSIEPSLADDRVTLRLTTSPGAARSNVSASFNLLPGLSYWLSLGPTDQSDAWIEDVEWHLPRNFKLHLRRADGLLTPWLMQEVKRADDDCPVMWVQTPGRPVPTFGARIDTFARISFGYCDKRRFRRVDVGALDAFTTDVYRYLGDGVTGLLFGEAETVGGFATDFAAGLLGWGDLRDVIKQLCFLVPGGEEFEWHQFTLALLGLGLDAAQFVAPQAAAPNAVLAVLKILLKRLQPFLHHRAAREIAELLGKCTMAVLKRLYELRVLLRTAEAAVFLDALRVAIPSGFFEFFFGDVETEDLEAMGRFAQRLTPRPFAYLSPLTAADEARALLDVQGAAADAERVRKLIARLMNRVEVVSQFFNPTWRSVLEMSEVLEFMAQLRVLGRRLDFDIDERMLEFIKHANGWPFGRLTDSAEMAQFTVLLAMPRLMTALQELEHLGDLRAMRGLMEFIIACGPHRADTLLRELHHAPDTADWFLAAVADVAQLVRRSTDGNHVDFIKVMNRALSGLAIESDNPAAREAARLGVEATILALQRYGKKLRSRVENGAINPIDRRGRQLLDALLTGREALEIKGLSIANLTDHFDGAARGILDQLAEVSRRLGSRTDVGLIRFCIHIPGPGGRAFFNRLAPRIRAFRAQLAAIQASRAAKGWAHHAVPEVSVVFITP
ncbi:MAG: hypothetical protein JNM17_01960 [Archangium sp.]|nr:hypothetical protein [Archangium sp.]